MLLSAVDKEAKKYRRNKKGYENHLMETGMQKRRRKFYGWGYIWMQIVRALAYPDGNS
jgi:hypothetical protein